ncbi:uncharacterized protein EV420DRAFT_710951 [Desarmillaria tabescens]|uniref:F-box domain-containing protein n=1 Tax=Armillaria tabescens TaxID=1929756 RepID=A0AA39MYX0_ARMTA|nr:uncharacterized protein EV420DRAFT_710951 [Desarmillaria tabescens]KAK0451308.1 hypothetical protein EV420DRAFT_710951 [Desarmillaria tabescens]
MMNGKCPRCGFTEHHISWSASDDLSSNRARIVDLLRSGESSLTVDLSPVHESSQRLESRLSDLNSKLSELNAVVDRLHTERQNIQSDLDAQRSLMAPVRRIPADILLQIFELLSVDEECNLDTANAPWVFGHVCCFWRTIVITSPVLWSTIRTHLNPLVHPRKISAALERHIELSSECPLHLDIDLYRNADSETIRQVVTLIVRHSLRWETLKITLSASTLPMFSRVSGRLPRLRSLAVFVMNYYGDGAIVPEPYSFFSVAPALTEAKIHCIPVFDLPVPLPQLRTFDGYFRNPSEVHDLLRRAPNLVKFAFSSMVISRDTNPSPLFHGSLRSITGTSHELRILSAGTFPALEEINGRESKWDDEAIDMIDRIAERSGCSIRTFHAGSILPFTRFCVLSSIGTSLTELSMTMGGWNGSNGLIPNLSIYVALLVSETQPTLLPCLRELTLKEFSGYNSKKSAIFTCPEFYEMVRSRLTPPAPVSRLKVLTLVLRRLEYQDLKPRDPRFDPLWALEEEGLVVHVVPPWEDVVGG